MKCKKCDVNFESWLLGQERVIGICQDCYDRGTCPDDKKEQIMKCKDCSVEIDVKLNYCASCVGKGFDLRPFEVKKPKYRIVGTMNSETAPYFYADNDDELKINISLLFSDYNIKEVMFKRIHEDWTWEDIKIGWSFKDTINKNCGISLKISEEDFIYFAPPEENSICSFEVYYANYISSKSGVITNVYDCPELAKILMIKRIIT